MKYRVRFYSQLLDKYIVREFKTIDEAVECIYQTKGEFC